MLSYEEMLKVVANEYVANSPDGRSRDQVYSHMLGNFKKGWLDKKFVNGCYDAIIAGKHVEFMCDLKEEMYGYFAGKSAEHMAEVLGRIKEEGASIVDKDGKEIRKLRFP